MRVRSHLWRALFLLSLAAWQAAPKQWENLPIPSLRMALPCHFVAPCPSLTRKTRRSLYNGSRPMDKAQVTELIASQMAGAMKNILQQALVPWHVGSVSNTFKRQLSHAHWCRCCSAACVKLPACAYLSPTAQRLLTRDIGWPHPWLSRVTWMPHSLEQRHKPHARRVVCRGCRQKITQCACRGRRA